MYSELNWPKANFGFKNPTQAFLGFKSFDIYKVHEM